MTIMENKKSLVVLILSLFALVANKDCISQTTDSLKYENGYLYYHEYGSRNLPAAILLTGGPGNVYDQLEGMAITLSPRLRCILLEQRGTGKSIPTPFDSSTINVLSVTKDVKTLMEGLGLNKSIIIGHSWGGMLAMNFAAQYPAFVKHLILIGPGPHKDGKNGLAVLIANRIHTRSFDEEYRLTLLNKLIEVNKADSSEILESKRLARRAYLYVNPIPDSLLLKVNAERNSKTEALLWEDIFQHFDVSKSLNNYKGKIDIISGRQDVVGFFSYELKQDFPNANLYWINQCGHFPMYERPAEFYKILFRILNVD